MRRISWLALPALCLATLPARPAHACGGFFCSSTPIDQASETIVYGLESDGTLTMSVQIRYAGDDDDFAWILPVPAPPEISVGTDALFDALDGATNPVFVAGRSTEGTCREHPRCVHSDGSTASTGGCGPSGGGGGGWTGGYVDAAASEPPPALLDAGGPPPDGGVTVFSQQSIGPYDTVVLGSASAVEVVTWLRDHEYIVPDAAVPLLEAYEGTLQIFVALRLSSNPETREIRPIVLRMSTEEACLPIRLTAIATVPDMPIKAYFLGDTSVVPFNYSVADLDLADLGFWNGARSYVGEVTRAVDAMGGQAFVTEYSGPTPAVQIEVRSVEDLATETNPSRIVRALAARGYPRDALLLEILERFILPPAGTEARDYIDCLAIGTAECGDPASFDPAGIVAAVESQITAPRREAHALVHRHRHLTRLFTTLSADEMTIDPVFVEDAGAPDASNVHVATLVSECSESYFEEDAPSHWEIGDTHIPESSGRFSNDSDYCAQFGAYPESEVPRSSSAPSRGCLCGVAGAGSVQWGALLAVLLITLGRRRRHR